MPTCLLGSQRAASPELNGARSISLFQSSETVKHFWVYFSVEEADPWFQLLPPHPLQESIKHLSQTAESRGQEDAPWSKLIQAGHIGVRHTLLGCHRGLSCVGLTLSSLQPKKTVFWYRWYRERCTTTGATRCSEPAVQGGFSTRLELGTAGREL